jgi:hypothetical protein
MPMGRVSGCGPDAPEALGTFRSSRDSAAIGDCLPSPSHTALRSARLCRALRFCVFVDTLPSTTLHQCSGLAMSAASPAIASPVSLSSRVSVRCLQGLISPSSVPPVVSHADASFAPPGPFGSVPRLRRYYAAFRLLDVHSASLCVIRSAVPLARKRRGLPGSCSIILLTCHALRPRRATVLDSLAAQCVLPSDDVTTSATAI